MQVYQLILANHERMNQRFKHLKGQRFINFDKTTWEYSSCNDLGVPYFKKVVNGRAQKKEYVVFRFDRDWLEGNK